MKSAFHAAALAAFVLCASACSPAGSTDEEAVAASDEPGEAQCRAVFEKGRELRGLTDPALDDVIEGAIAKCTEEGNLSQDDYECAMAAETGQELTACHMQL